MLLEINLVRPKVDNTRLAAFQATLLATVFKAKLTTALFQ